MTFRSLVVLIPAIVGCACFSSGSLHAASLQATLTDAEGAPIEHAVITLRGDVSPPHPQLVASMDQVGQLFSPYVLPVHAGTSVRFPNRDDIRHHVYSFSPAKRFELRLYEGTPAEPVVFDQPGVAVLGCNIHDWMLGYVYVTPDHWFAVSDAKGQVRLEDVPPGRYAVTLWHPQAKDLLPQPGGELTLEASGSEATFAVALQGPAQPAPNRPAQSGFAEAFRKKAADAR